MRFSGGTTERTDERGVRGWLGAFLGFAAISGGGWLIDFATYSLLVRGAFISGFAANFVSSYLGVTFVWFVALSKVFDRSSAGSSRYLALYWGFQALSIFAYSTLIHYVQTLLVGGDVLGACCINSAVGAKIIVTPINLATNFGFMKILTGYMNRAGQTHV